MFRRTWRLSPTRFHPERMSARPNVRGEACQRELTLGVSASLQTSEFAATSQTGSFPYNPNG